MKDSNFALLKVDGARRRLLPVGKLSPPAHRLESGAQLPHLAPREATFPEPRSNGLRICFLGQLLDNNFIYLNFGYEGGVLL